MENQKDKEMLLTITKELIIESMREKSLQVNERPTPELIGAKFVALFKTLKDGTAT